MRQRAWAAIAAALLFAPTSRAQSLPTTDPGFAAESQASTAAATQPASVAASSPLDGEPALSSTAPAAAAGPVADPDAWWKRFNLATLVSGMLCSGTGLALAAPWAYGTISIAADLGPPTGWRMDLLLAALVVSANLGLLNLALAPVLIGIGGLSDSVMTGSQWWPPLVGATVGWIAALAAVAGTSIAVYVANPMHYQVGLFARTDPKLGFAVNVFLAAAAVVAPATLGGALLADALFQPESDAPASAPAAAR